jgi:deoxyadenosine/deoxycytidine kinase
MAAEIIEIIGPPGIGKTTLYNALCKKWRPSCYWTYQDALLTPVPSFADFNNWIGYKLKKVLKKKLSKSVPTEFGFRFAQLHPELIIFCWQQLSDESVYSNNKAGMRFRSVFHLYLDFCRYQAIAEKESPRPCILNEGLLQKSFLVQTDLRLMPDLIDKYLTLVPLPKAIIYINTEDRELIVERLSNREKTIATHLGKNKKELLEDIVKWQYQLELIITWMLDHNVMVYNIDGARSVEENVLFVTKILEKQKYFQMSHGQMGIVNVNAAQPAAISQ